MAAAYVVASAEMNAEMHVRRALKTLVVKPDVCIEHLICSLFVLLIRSPTLQHILRAEVRQVRIINLDVPDALCVQNLQLLLVCFRNILEVFLIVRVHLLGEASSV